MSVAKRFGPRNCPACHGRVECHGGGNKRCIQRNPVVSRIAGILNSYGGVRVVVAHPDTFKQHLRCGEFLCRVPGKTVHEPVAWGDIPYVVRLGELAVEHFVKKNEFSNDSDTQQAVRAWKSRQTWHPESRGSLDLTAIAYT